MKAQLRITSEYNKDEIGGRKSAIKELQDRARQLHEKWFGIFGWDTPVPIDMAWHNLTVAMKEIQTADRCRPYIEEAREQLDQTEWIISCEQSKSDSKPL